MHLTVVAVGRLKSPELSALCADYAHRLQRYARLAVVEVRDAREADAQKGQAREAEALLQRVPAGSQRVALDAAGTLRSSEELAAWLAAEANAGRSSLCFLIGGPRGLSADLLGRAEHRLSLSRLTLPHEIARLVLLEQLYRAMTIIRGESYHK